MCQREAVLVLQEEHRRLLEMLESPVPEPETLPPAWVPPPPLTEAEIQALRDSMPDPLEEIEHRLGLSTTPLSPQTWAD